MQFGLLQLPASQPTEGPSSLPALTAAVMPADYPERGREDTAALSTSAQPGF